MLENTEHPFFVSNMLSEDSYVSDTLAIKCVGSWLLIVFPFTRIYITNSCRVQLLWVYTYVATRICSYM